MSAPTSGADAVSPLTAEERARLIARVAELRRTLAETARERPNMPYAERAALREQTEVLRDEYFARLPRVPMSRCPVCGEELVRAFDPWGLDGFWWQEKLRRDFDEPPACEHFRVLSGALGLNGLPPVGGIEESHPGPEVPYVIPRVLAFPTMVAVVASLPMVNGYTAYPIAYFSEQPPGKLMLANPWNFTSATVETPKGAAWTIFTDAWDFELLPWVERGRVRWIEPGREGAVLSTREAAEFPFAALSGARQQQVIVDGRRQLLAPPNEEEVDPFSG
jgi:hypothetical protein